MAILKVRGLSKAYGDVRALDNVSFEFDKGILSLWLISAEGQATLDSVGREASRKGFPSKTSIENAYGAGTQPIPVHDKLFMEDPRKWLDTHVRPIWGK